MTAGLQAWLGGDPPGGEIAVKLHESLGKPPERGWSITLDFFLADKPGMALSWDWLTPKAQRGGTTACAVFKDRRP